MSVHPSIHDSVCLQGGGISPQSSRGRGVGQVQLGGGVRSSRGGGVRSNWGGGQVQPGRGGQVQLVGGGVSPQFRQGGQVQLPGGVRSSRVGGAWGHRGVRSSRWGGGSGPAVGGGVVNRMSSHYTAGGMPLAFTQEDFLVLIYLLRGDQHLC